MALALNDRVQQTGTANTTVSFTLTGSVVGFQTFAVIGNGNTTYYAATDASGSWEVGIGTYATSGPTLTRTTILASSNSGSAVTFSGTVNVFVTYPAEKSINYDANDVATIGQTLSYSDTGIIGSFASTVAGYNQVVIQNKSAATNASSNLNISNDVSTSSAGYVEVGINSSNFTGTGSFSLPSASYLASASTDLTIGTYGAYNVHFVTNSSTTDAMTIFNSGGVSLGGNPDPGIGTLYANNVYLGFNTITAAAGTTVFTNSSAGWTQVVGTTTQTLQMPVATTLYKGLAFTIKNNSTGNVTITDNASATLDTVVTGGTAIMVLTDNSTSAGTWKAYSYLPSSYDFNTATASFGGATINNATWNGTTIATGYGGTGLTTFAAANNAIYSTSSSALAAGTLPIAAGGTAKTTFTANGVVYGNGTSALGVTGAGTTGQVLLANTSGAPTWGSVPSTGAVNTFQTSLNGLTPSSATSGAVTLAGTLGAISGGTGLTTFSAANNALYSTSSSALAAGTLPVAAGGTGVTASTGASSVMLRDANQNTTINNIAFGTTTTATAGGTTVLTVASSAVQNFTGTSAQNVQLPDATTLILGHLYYINNQSNNNVSIKNNAGTTLYTLSGGAATQLTLITNSTANGTWQQSAFIPNNVNWGTTGVYAASTTAQFSSLTLGTALTVSNGGTGSTSFTAYGVLTGGTTSTGAVQSVASVGTSGQVLTSNGAGALPTFQTVSAGLTVTNDTTTATALYPTFTSATSGSISGISVTSSKFTFVPTTGSLTAPQTVASNGLVVNSNTVSASYSIPSGSSATSTGPMTIGSGVTVTVPTGSRWVVL